MPEDRTGSTVVALIVLAFFVWSWAIIFRKAGYPWAMGLLMAVPCLNALTFLYFAFSEWPVLAQLARNSPQSERDRPTDRIDTMLQQAASLERIGQHKDAAVLFETLAKELNGQPGSHFAAQQANRIRQRYDVAAES
jgi:hypothetical protein